MQKKTVSKTQTFSFLKPTLAKQDLKSVLRCLLSDTLTRKDGGQYTLELEQKFCQLIACRDAVFLANESLAFYFLGKALGLNAGDEVILSPLIEVEIFEAMHALGLRNIFADLKPKSFMLAEQSLEKKIHSRTKAIILSHSFGFLQAELAATCARLKQSYPWLIIIEDATQAMGTSFKKAGRYHAIGTEADFAIFSMASSRLVTAGKGAFISLGNLGLKNSKNKASAGRAYEGNLELLRQLSMPHGFSYLSNNIGGTSKHSQLRKVKAGKLLNQKEKFPSAKKALDIQQLLVNFRKPFQRTLEPHGKGSSLSKNKGPSQLEALRLCEVARLDFSPTELESALALSQLSLLEAFLSRNATLYKQFLAACSQKKLAYKESPGKNCNYSFFPLWLPKESRRATLQKFAQVLSFPVRLETFTAYGHIKNSRDLLKGLSEKKKSLANQEILVYSLELSKLKHATDLHENLVLLPISPSMDETQVEKILALLKNM